MWAAPTQTSAGCVLQMKWDMRAQRKIFACSYATTAGLSQCQGFLLFFFCPPMSDFHLQYYSAFRKLLQSHFHLAVGENALVHMAAWIIAAAGCSFSPYIAKVSCTQCHCKQEFELPMTKGAPTPCIQSTIAVALTQWRPCCDHTFTGTALQGLVGA